MSLTLSNNYIKINTLGWIITGQLRKYFNTKPIGIRKIERPKRRWEDDVIQDIKTLGVKNWRNLAMGKESW
jgi:hypothetical protein